MEKEVKYLGIWVGERDIDIFRAKERLWTTKANKKPNKVIAQIKKS